MKAWHFTLGLSVFALVWLRIVARLVMPAIAPVDRDLAHNVEELHELGGTLGYGLIGLHAAASLFPYYVLKDGLMRRMMPGRA